MLGMNQNPAKNYQDIDVESSVAAASPLELVVLLYDGAIKSCKTAIYSIDQKDAEKKGAALTKAILIIESGLRSSLDKKAGGELAENLDSMYRYMTDRLYYANIKMEAEPVQEVVDLLLDLRSAWDAISKKPNSKERKAINNRTEVKLGAT